MVDPVEDPKHKDLSALRIDPELRAGSGRGKRLLWILAAVILVIGLSLVLVSFKNRDITVEVAPVRAANKGEAVPVLNASGYVTPRRRATVAAKITGRVVEMLVEEGMRVEDNQVLARLDDSEAKARLASAKADRAVALTAIQELEVNLADADRTVKRNRELKRSGYVSVQDLDRVTTAANGLRARLQVAREQVRAAEARIEVAREDLEDCTVRAPFAGIAVSKDAQVGEMVSPVSAGGGYTRTGIATIVDMESLEIEVDVNESYIAKVKPSQKVEAVLDAYPDWRIPAKVRTVIPTADRQKATVKVRISFDALDPRILPDMGVKVSFLSDEDASQKTHARTLIPTDAVREVDGKKVVFVLREGRLEKRVVELGAPNGGNVGVLAGVSEGELLVVRGPEGLRDGQRAKAKE